MTTLPLRVSFGKPNALRMWSNVALRTLFMTGLSLCCCMVLHAQNIQRPNATSDFTKRSDLRVDPSTLGLNIQIPLGNYPGRAGSNTPIVLNYSSKVYEIKFKQGPEPTDFYSIWAEPTFADNTTAGWTHSLGLPFLSSVGSEWYTNSGGLTNDCFAGCWLVRHVTIVLPDGSSHDLRHGVPIVNRPGGQVFPSYSGMYFAIDGSQLKYDFDPKTLYLPDGSRLSLDQNPTVMFDRNGNKQTYNPQNGTWTDTIGRVIPVPFTHHQGPSSLVPLMPGDYPYQLPGVPGYPLNYTFRWKLLQNALSPLQSLLPLCAEANPNNPGANYPGPWLFYTGYPDSVACGDGSSPFNPLVLAEIILPTNQSYKFSYNSYGEIDKVVYPTGGYERYRYEQIPAADWIRGIYAQANRGVVERWISPKGDGSDESLHHWTYSASYGPNFSPPYKVTITAPDSTRTERLLFSAGSFDYPFGFRDLRTSRAYEERFYSSTNQLLRRSLTKWTAGSQNGYANARDPHLDKQVEIVFNSGSNALAQVTTNAYDVSQNITSTSKYDFKEFDPTTAQSITVDDPSLPGTFLRRDETIFLVNDPAFNSATQTAYGLRNLVALPSETRVFGPSGMVAQTLLRYDENAFIPSGSTIYWQDPANDKRGNLTTSSSWVNTNGTYLSTRAQFDQYGNVRKTFDARDTNFTNPTQLEYSGDSQFAYPTTLTSSIPDLSGVHGSNLALVTTNNYDFNTGLMLWTLDANGQITVFTYNDVLNRPKTIAAADGGLTTYNYTDTPGSVSVEKVTKLNTSQNTVSRQNFDGLARPKCSFLFIGGSSYITDNVEYDNLGRGFRVSNSYLSNGAANAEPPSGTWTTTAYDELGRTKTVTTPDLSVSTTTYSGSLVLINIPSGKQRISKTNSIGQVTDVWEVTPNDPAQYPGIEPVTFAGQTYYGYRTRYEYDGLGNLNKVMQGPQLPQPGAQPPRTFIYNSLKQLLSSTSPENGTVTFLYDNNGNMIKQTDARGVATNYSYDWFNRNNRAVSSNDPAGTPTIDRYYDGFRDGNSSANIQNSKGHLWQIETSGATGSKTTFNELDSLGRPKSKSQQFSNGTSWGYSFTTRRTYNLAGEVLSQTYPSGRTLNYTYDTAGRVATFNGNLGDGVQRTYATNISYDEAGRLKEEQFGTQTPLYHKLHYNIRGQLNDVRLSTASWAADEWNWNRGAIVNYYSSADLTCPTAQCRYYGGNDNNGNLRQSQHWIPANDQMNPYNWTEDRFAYDALNRLKSMAEFHGSPGGLGGQDFIQVYDYDRFGNRTINQTATQGNGAPEPNFAVDPTTNRLNVPAGQTGNMHYDAAGNLDNDSYSSFGSSNGTPTRTYDALSRITAVKNGSLQVVSTYTYNGDGQRVRRNANGSETWQIYGMDNELLAEYRANAVPLTPTREYAYRSGQLLNTVTNGDDQRLKRFVENLYYGALQRDPNAQEVAATTADLANAAIQGQSQLLTKAGDIARALFAQSNYEATKTETQYVSDLYYTYLNRAADSSGLGWWAPQAVGGTTNRINVLNAFQASGEFQALVANLYGTSTGDNQRTENLVNNFYLGAYGRFANSTELAQQRDRLNNKAAEGLWPVQSEAETMGRELLAAQVTDYSISDGQYVTNLYESFLQRGPDSGGLGFWTSIAAGGSSHRQEVLNAFATCGPFRDLAGALYREVFWVVPDHLGTPRMIATRFGNLASVKRHDYLPFGEELGLVGGRTTTQGYSQVDNVRQKFTEKERDQETGLDYFGARYYSSIQGRFTSADPSQLSIVPANPQTWNRYTYALNNPLLYVDKNGKWPTWIHELIIDMAFPSLSDTQRQKIKDGSWSVDDPQTGGQNTSHSNEHGMTIPGQTPEDAAEQAGNFINTNVDKAQALKNKGEFTMSLCYFGKAFHTVTDMTSPAHEGYQVWKYYELSIHMDEEKLIGDYRLGLAVGASLNLYKYTYGAAALKQAANYTPGGADDPSVMAIHQKYSMPGSSFQAESFALAQYRRGLRDGLNFDWSRQWGQRGRRMVDM